jgi:diaminopimelate decarboxylase
MGKVMRAHEAGALHSDGYGAAPQWLPHPEDVNALLPVLWARNVAKGADGVLAIAGVPVTRIAQEFGTPAYVVDEDDFRARARAFRDEFAAPFAGPDGSGPGLDVYYAGKAFLCSAVARWVAEEGLGLDVCSGGELAVAMAVGFPAARIGMHGNNKSVAEVRAALEYGVGRIVLDSYAEIERVAAVAAELGVVAPVMIRVTAGVEAHTHEFIATAHEDQKFGFSLAGGHAAKAAAQVLAHPDTLDLRGLHSHIGSQIFDTAGFEVAARRVLGLHAAVAREHAVELPELDLGGGFGIAYTSENTPLATADLGAQLASIVTRECAAEGVPAPRVSIEPGRAIAGPSTFTLYEVGTIKKVELDGGARRVRLGRRRDERQRPHRALRGGLLGDARQPAQRRSAHDQPGGGQALRVGRHRRHGRIPAGRPARRRPAGGAGDGGVLPRAVESVQPRAAPAGGGGPGQRRPAHRPPRDDRRHPGPRRGLT